MKGINKKSHNMSLQPIAARWAAPAELFVDLHGASRYPRPMIRYYSSTMPAPSATAVDAYHSLLLFGLHK